MLLLSVFLLSSSPVTTANKKSLVIDYNILANEQQVIAFFLPEAPTEMLKVFDEVCTHAVCICILLLES